MQTFSSIHQQLAPELERMNDIIRRTLHTSNPLMNSVVTNYLRTKGKQIRPMLVILSARFFGEVNDAVLHAGAALEMLHNASLIHDDVVDNTELRRGLPTINAVEGNHIAVLVGDFFVSNALAAGIATGHLQVISALSALGKELSIGEIDQISNVREHNFDEESYIAMIRKKTASLFINCVDMGATTVGATPQQIEPLKRYAELLGLCFQIRDDIFDYFDDPNIGKPTGNDLREGKVTLPLLYALNNAPDVALRDKYKDILRRDDLDEEMIQQLIMFARENGGIEYACDTMRTMQRRAAEILTVYPDTRWRQAFEDLFEFIISRQH
ncbi:MAG: polyprenyl synthetase family protein [Muribaculaceae bacterium]|nr:polyprenyl synthetase family protein [Muribaculaceae bacterium]